MSSRINSILKASEEAKLKKYENIDRLVIVLGHSIFTGSNQKRLGVLSNWAWEGWQDEMPECKPGWVCAILHHIILGLQQMKLSDVELSEQIYRTKNEKEKEEVKGKSLERSSLDRSILMFSGGQTRNGTGPRSEGGTYYAVAEANNFFGVFTTPEELAKAKAHMFAEEFARDSYENLIFSIARFFEITGRYPKYICAVGFEVKRERFGVHRRALSFASENFTYIGNHFQEAKDAIKKLVISNLSPVGGEEETRMFNELKKLADKPITPDQQKYDERLTPEQKKLCFKDYSIRKVDNDIRLCGPESQQTKIERNPYTRVPPYLLACPELAELLQPHCEFNLPLPKPKNTQPKPTADFSRIRNISNELITEEQLQNEFRKYDTANRGFLNRTEFVKAYRDMEGFGLNLSQDEIEELFSSVCADRQTISYDEFCVLMLKRSQM